MAETRVPLMTGAYRNFKYVAFEDENEKLFA